MGAPVKTTTRAPGRSEAGYMAALIGALCIPTSLSATSVADQMPTEASTIHYLPATNETHVTARLDPALCVALSLPQQWRREGAEELDRSVSPHPEGLEKSKSRWRAVRDLAELPQGNVGSKTLSCSSGTIEDFLAARRMPARSDARRCHPLDRDMDRYRLPAPSHSLTVETYIVPASREWLLELSISDIDDRSLYEDLVRQVLRMSGPPARPNAARRAELPLCRRSVCGLPNSTLRRGRDGTRW